MNEKKEILSNCLTSLEEAMDYLSDFSERDCCLDDSLQHLQSVSEKILKQYEG